jgi:surfeit locus 1 family protein
MDATGKKSARTFAPGPLMTLATVALLALFLSLGRWQWNRGVDRQAQWDAFARGGGAAVPVSGPGLASLERFTGVALRGAYDGGQQFLLDNRSFEGRPGFEVLTILRLVDGSAIPVDRGWIPFDGYRDRLPAILVASDERQVIGRIDNLPSGGLDSGRAPPATTGPWPRLTSFPLTADLQAAYGAPLLDGMVLLDPGEPDGYLRKWRPPGLEPDKHKSYAIQWWGFAVLLLVLYVGLNFKTREPRP